MTDQWTQPDLPFEGGMPVDRVKLTDLHGYAVLVAVGGTHSQWPTKYEPADAVRVCMVILNGPRAGEELIDIMVFNAQPLRRLRGVPGRAFVGHIEVDDPTDAKSPILLLDPTPEEYEAASKWHAQNPSRTNELIEIAVSAYNSAEAGRGRTQQRPQAQPPRRSAPPTGPGYNQPPSSPPPGGPPPPPNTNLQAPPEPPF